MRELSGRKADGRIWIVLRLVVAWVLANVALLGSPAGMCRQDPQPEPQQRPADSDLRKADGRIWIVLRLVVAWVLANVALLGSPAGMCRQDPQPEPQQRPAD